MHPKDIAYCHACGAGMDVTAMEPFTNVECPECRRHTRVKTEFGAYTLTRRHAIGGMSMVFIAQDNTLDREVVVKILNKEYSADEKRIRAFEQEARITASISHPNVVRVFTTGRVFRRFFIAMEFVTGGHFEHHIRERGTIPEIEALGLAIEVAEGLKAAHHAGLIHRDIKPGNILLDAAGSAKIVDFGLALVTQGGKARASEIWATPYYVPPETIEGAEEDFRSDIYAFGATFYHALAGKPPCDEESMETNRLRQSKKEVRPLEAVARWLRPETCGVIDRCMAYQPERRFRSYSDLIGALRRAREYAAEQVPPPAKTAVPVRGLRGSPRTGGGAKLAVAGAAVAVGAALFFAVKTIFNSPEIPAIDPAPGGGAAALGRVPGPAPSAGTSGGVQIARRYAEAGKALREGDHRLARRRFGEVRDDPRVLEPTGSWAACEAVAMAWLDGDGEAAAQEIRRALAHIEGAGRLQSGTRRRLIGGLHALLDLPPIAAPDPDDSEPEADLLALLGALKNWEQGMLDRAEPMFRRLAEASADGPRRWLEPYIPVAGAYLADLEALRGAEPPRFDLPPAQCRERIEELDLLIVSLKTKGRARFNVRCWQLALERAARRTGSSAPPEPVAGPQALGELFRACRFKEADEVIRNWDPENAEERERRQALLLLNQASIAFLAELGEQVDQSAGAGPVEARDGTLFPEVVGGREDGLEVIAADGSSTVAGWSELDPESLIELHRRLVKDRQGELETFRRHEQAVAFGLLAGDAERAKAAGNKLAELSDGFRQRWERIVPTLE